VPVHIGEHGAVAAEYGQTDEFRGARFTGTDLSGARFRDCDLRNVKIAGAFLTDVNLSGIVGNLVVEDVDVTAFVAGELDRRYPERVPVREMRTADDYRATWDTIERLWAETVARAERLPEPARHERVDEEWSFVETLRHLVFATDLWAGHMVLDRPAPYHPLGLPATDHPPEDLAALPVDPDSRPSYAQVLAARRDRMALVRGIVDGLTDDGLERMCTGARPAARNEQPRPVRGCLRVVMNEEVEHRRYALRDLAVLEGRA
jgi:DinB superfamily/Pentapeptide repeats (8 copies)